MYTVQQNAGTIKLHTGSTLNPKSNGLYLNGGTVQIVGDLPGKATIQGSFWFDGGTIEFTGNLAIFKVTDQVKWTLGTFKPRIDVIHNALQDTWEMGSLVIPAGSTPSIAPVSLNWVQGQDVNASYRWVVIRINGAVTTNNVTPAIVNNGPNYQRYVANPQPGITDWQLGVP